jgi:threonine synthase
MPLPTTSDVASRKEPPQPVAANASFMFRCIGCDAMTSTAAQDFRCAQCGNLLEIASPAWTASSLNADALKSTWLARRSSHSALDLSGVWRYRELLPNPQLAEHVVTLREGNTPLYELPRCARLTGVPRLYAKHQGLNPTGSFKDTGMTVAATFARQAGCNWVACASTGNTSASMAAYAARAGIRSLVLVPDGKISWSKLSQALDYGALTCQLRTDFDGCLQLLQQLVKQAPVYQLNSINPFRLEGQKTQAIELLEQFDWQPPDHIIVPGGNLGNSSALGKALIEMRAIGLISHLPKLSVIQAEGANALVRTLRETDGKRLIKVQPETRATAIVGKGSEGNSRHRRHLRTGQRNRDRASQGRDRRRRHWMRTRLRRHARGIEDIGEARLCETRRKRSPGAHRKPAERSRLHHGIPQRRASARKAN